MAGSKSDGDIAKLSFEDALQELEDIVRRLEGDQVDLDDAILAYQRGAALKRHCELKLRDAQEKVQKIKLEADGGVAVEDAPGPGGDPL